LQTNHYLRNRKPAPMGVSISERQPQHHLERWCCGCCFSIKMGRRGFFMQSRYVSKSIYYNTNGFSMQL